MSKSLTIYRRNSHGQFSNSDKFDNPEPYKLDEFKVYAHFLSLPDNQKSKVYGFKTEFAFAKKYKVSRQVLSNWCDNPELWKLRNRFLFKQLKKVTPNILQALEKGALKNKKASEIALWLEKVEGMITPIQIEDNTSQTQKATITADDILDMIPNEKLRKRIRMKLLQKKYQDRLPS